MQVVEQQEGTLNSARLAAMIRSGRSDLVLVTDGSFDVGVTRLVSCCQVHPEWCSIPDQCFFHSSIPPDLDPFRDHLPNGGSGEAERTSTGAELVIFTDADQEEAEEDEIPVAHVALRETLSAYRPSQREAQARAV